MAKESSLKNMVLVLTTITLVASALLSVVYLLTKEPIEQVKIKKVNDAIREVVPEFDNNPYNEVKVLQVDGREVRVYPATKGGQLVGEAIETFTMQGFSGEIVLMVGFLPDGTISKTSVISHAETPGLGDKIDKNKSNFSAQFEGKNPETFKLAVKKDGGDVDAITASTISSRAFCDAVRRAYDVYKQQEKKEVSNE